ncbi:MAG TPA: hypothetical protein VFG14_17040, partial [Chthoniobacteraceae bacterium]|nr:hypothetical protein [Chthoniobacteraceae bacterium]
ETGLKDGREFVGVIKSENSNSITLLQAGGLTGTFLKSDAKVVQPSKVSLMPSDLEKSITVQEMADLLAFLAK